MAPQLPAIRTPTAVHIAEQRPQRPGILARASASIRGGILQIYGRAYEISQQIRRAPARLGVSIGRVASKPYAELDLETIGSSPAVYAAAQRRCLGLQQYPIRIVIGRRGGEQETVSPADAPWAAALLALLEQPDPADADRILPENPGEVVLAQLGADFLVAGDGFARLQVAPQGSDVIGLHRLHPRSVGLERVGGQDLWVHQPPWGTREEIPVGQVAHLRSIGASAGGRGALGIGAGEPLRALLRAEGASLEYLAETVEAGGVDALVTAKTDRGAAYLEDPDRRRDLANQIATGLQGRDPTTGKARRVMVASADFNIAAWGLDPDSVTDAELMTLTRDQILMALGCTPSSVGADTSSYATAVQQARIQADLDAQMAMVYEACLLRPLARYFARRAGLREWQQVTARYDLSTHPGQQYARTDAIDRAAKLVELGYSTAQAVAAEGLDLPDPEGAPAAAPAPGGGSDSRPNRPQGSGRMLSDLFRRGVEDVDLSPTEAMREEAQRGLDWHEEGHSGDGMKPETVAWARRIAAGEDLSEEKTRDMRAWHARHEVDREGEGYNPGEPGYPSPGRVANALWCGEPGQRWSERKVAELDRAKED
jgi:hypothetical protein